MKKASKKSKKPKQAPVKPQARAGHVFAQSSDIMYVAGGYNASGPLIDV
jgi:hypothetical protein